jgi:hypothetical protein
MENWLTIRDTTFNDIFQYPWQVWGIGLFGIVATLGGDGAVVGSFGWGTFFSSCHTAEL